MRRFDLRTRILVMLLGILLPLQLVTSAVVLERAHRDAEAHAQSMLSAGGRVFGRLIEDREEALLASVEVLVADFALKRAIASGDGPTIRSALRNHGRRIDADLAFLSDEEGRIDVRTPRALKLDPRSTGWRTLLEEAREKGSASGIAIASGRPHQIVIAPINAPLPIGWVGMGFELDAALAAELRQLTGLEVAFWAWPDDAPQPRISSTHDALDEASLARALAAGAFDAESGAPMRLASSDWISLPVDIAAPRDSAGRAHVGVVLQTSASEAMSAYRALQSDLVRFFALGVLLALVGAVFTSRRLTRPLASLAEAARGLATGRFETRIRVHSRDEIGDLAQTFRVMQGALADREREIVHRSIHDPLTGLPNRTTVEAEIAERLAADGRGFAVAILDIEQLKDVNGTLGAAIGDAVLTTLAERLRVISTESWVARIGGDDFLVVFPCRSEMQALTDLEQWIEFLQAPHTIRGVKLQVGLCGGIAIAPADGETPESLLRRAEMALGVAKERGLAVARYVPGLEEANQRRIGILIELERAIEADDLELHYQPKIEIATGRAIGVEALVRWTHPRMGRMNPAEFVEIAEQAGSVGLLSGWVIDTAIEQVRRWRASGIDLAVSINLSALDLMQGDLPARLREKLAALGEGASRIVVEVTESAVMSDPERAVGHLEAIRAAGAGIAIDDFGTGHSSLAQLRNLPSDELKIDQAFVRHLRPGSVDEVIVRTAIELGHTLGLRVVAEGIEDRITYDLLARHGCDVAQGYWIARPMPAEKIGRWLDDFEKYGLGGRAGDADGELGDGSHEGEGGHA